MKTIKGVTIEEIEELSYNIQKIQTELKERTSFWTNYNKVVLSYKEKSENGKVSILFKCMLFIALSPKFIESLLKSKSVKKLIDDAVGELIEYYELPKTKVRRFRLKCEYAMEIYEDEINLINEEIELQTKHLNLSSIGEKMKMEIKQLLHEFQDRKRKKQSKYEFYHKCGIRLLEIEEQINVKHSIELSRQKLKQIEEFQSESVKQKEIEKEFELYAYYGDLLDSISVNLEKLEKDKKEQLEELEIKEMLSSLKIKE